MSQVQLVGEWQSRIDDSITELKMRFVPLDLVAHWKRCGMVADFLAHFLAYNFEETSEATNIVSTVLNEVLENAVKFSCDKHTKISLTLRHTGDFLEIETTNVSTMNDAQSLVQKLTRINNEDIEDLFVQQLEYTAATDSSASGLGLISLKKDYNASLGAKLITLDNGKCEIVFRLLMATDEIEQRIGDA